MYKWTESADFKGLKVKLSTCAYGGAQYVSVCVRTRLKHPNGPDTLRLYVGVHTVQSVQLYECVCLCVCLLAETKWVLPPLAHILGYNKAFCLFPRGVTYHNDIRQRRPRVFGVY